MTTTSGKPSGALDKKDVQKLQRAIIDGLEDVKAQDIVVFDTEHITSLFERVIVASGSSNRQTKALASSVRDAVREAGFAKPRIEGEENGEWIIVDCGAAVAHIMQPTIRQYYHLEELWGEKPVKLKLGAPAPLVKAARTPAAVEPVVVAKARSGARVAAKKAAKPPVRDHEPGYIGKLGKTSDWTAKRNEATAVEEPPAKPARASSGKAGAAAVKKPGAKGAIAAPAPAKGAARRPAAAKSVPAKVAVPKTTKAAIGSAAAPAKAAAKKAVAKKAPAKKVSAKRAPAAEKVPARKAASSPVSVASPGRAPAKKAPARKTASRGE